MIHEIAPLLIGSFALTLLILFSLVIDTWIRKLTGLKTHREDGPSWK